MSAPPAQKIQFLKLFWLRWMLPWQMQPMIALAALDIIVAKSFMLAAYNYHDKAIPKAIDHFWWSLSPRVEVFDWSIPTVVIWFWIGTTVLGLICMVPSVIIKWTLTRYRPRKWCVAPTDRASEPARPLPPIYICTERFARETPRRRPAQLLTPPPSPPPVRVALLARRGRCVAYEAFRPFYWRFWRFYLTMQGYYNYYWGTATFVATVRSSSNLTGVGAFPKLLDTSIKGADPIAASLAGAAWAGAHSSYGAAAQHDGAEDALHTAADDGGPLTTPLLKV